MLKRTSAPRQITARQRRRAVVSKVVRNADAPKLKAPKLKARTAREPLAQQLESLKMKPGNGTGEARPLPILLFLFNQLKSLRNSQLPGPWDLGTSGTHEAQASPRG